MVGEQEKKSTLALPEVFLSTNEIKRQVSRWAHKGEVRKIAPRLYTRNMVEPPEAIVKRNLWQVVALLFPDHVVSHRTAMELRPSPDGSITLTGTYPRRVRLPGVLVRVLDGPPALPGDMPFMAQLVRASDARFLLECLKPHRKRAAEAAGVSRDAIEAFLERKLKTAGEEELNAIRDRARTIAPELNAAAEAEVLSNIVGTLLGTKQAALSAPAAIARAQGEPYDPPRLERFQRLLADLAQWSAKRRPVETDDDQTFVNAAFIDAYFSNYIEGTEFEIDEARAIVFENRIPSERPDDAHDVMGTYRLTASRDAMGRSITIVAPTYEQFQEVLRARHAVIMEGRPDKKPGEFKKVANRAENSHFVDPDYVKGTLRRGYDLLGALTDPFARAAFMMFLIAEVHPFADGNGRIARVMMNAELVSAKQARIIIPTAFREDYLGGLRELTRNDRSSVFLKALDRAQEFVSQISFTDLDAAIAELAACNAFEEGPTARLRLPSEVRA